MVIVAVVSAVDMAEHVETIPCLLQKPSVASKTLVLLPSTIYNLRIRSSTRALKCKILYFFGSTRVGVECVQGSALLCRGKEYMQGGEI